MRVGAWLLLLFAVACGGSEPATGPTPASTPSPAQPPPAAPAPPPPSNITVGGTITSTVSGQQVGTFSDVVMSLPAPVSISLPGYITREAWITTAQPTVDLFPDAGFDVRFYRQFTRNGLETPTTLQPLRLLPQSPSIYIETEGAKGVSTQVAAELQRVAQRIIPAMTGGRLQLARWEAGPTARALQPGWIMVERRDEQGVCGRAIVGAPAGQIWLDSNGQGCQFESVFAHELGHALGFYHVERDGFMMYRQQRASNHADAPTEQERYYAGLAYARTTGNQDIDRDPQRPTTAAAFSVTD